MSSKKTNAIGIGTQNMTINVPKTLLKQIDKLAKKSGMTRSNYIKTFLEEEAVKKNVAYKTVIVRE